MGNPRKKSATASKESRNAIGAEAGVRNPQTCCSNCQTVFEVPVELLASSDTRVRCGECLSIFDALANLRDDHAGVDEEPSRTGQTGGYQTGRNSLETYESNSVAAQEEVKHKSSNLPTAEAAALAGLSNDTSALDVTYSDFDLFSEEADLPEVAYFDQTRDTPEFDFDAIELDEDETFSDTLFSHDVTVDARSVEAESGADSIESVQSDVDFVTDETPREPLVFNYRDREDVASVLASTSYPSNELIEVSADSAPAPGYRDTDLLLDSEPTTPDDSAIIMPAEEKAPWLFRTLMFLLVCAIAAGLYLYRERNNLYNNALARPIMIAGCSVFNCTVPERVDLSALKVLKRSVFSHPTLESALVINVGFVNQAPFNQRYPILVIRLTDRRGQLVKKNNFSPEQYLENWREGDTLDAGKRLDISLTVEDPGQNALSFELDFQ